MKNNVSKSSEMFPCEQPPRDSYVPPPPPSDEQLRRLAPDLNKVTSFAHVMLLGDQKTPILAKQPVWKSREMLRLVGLVEKHLFPEAQGTVPMKCDRCGQHKESVRSRKMITVGLQSGTVRWQFCDECAATVADAAEKTRAGGNCPEKQSRERDRWMRLTKMTIIPVAVAALAGFVGGYNSRAPNHPVEVAVARSSEIRRAIPVEPEIRKAIPVQTRKPQVDRRSDSMAFISPGRAIARDFATRRANANPLVGKTSRSVIRRKASK
jgi:hypothetical protein